MSHAHDSRDKAASESRKPILLAVWLGGGDQHSEEFRKVFDDERVERLSTSFHMVQAPWGSDSAVAKQWDLMPFIYAPQMDGSYVPRAVFLNSRAQAQLITNRDLLSHRWYYYHPDSLVRSMEEAIEVMINGAELKPPPQWTGSDSLNPPSEEDMLDSIAKAEEGEDNQEKEDVENSATKSKLEPIPDPAQTTAPKKQSQANKSLLQRKLEQEQQREAAARAKRKDPEDERERTGTGRIASDKEEL